MHVYMFLITTISLFRFPRLPKKNVTGSGGRIRLVVHFVENSTAKKLLLAKKKKNETASLCFSCLPARSPI